MQRLKDSFIKQFFNKICTRSILVLSILLLPACGDPIKEQALQQLPITEKRVTQLGEALSNGQVRNANLINQYADKVSKLKPSLNALTDEFSKDASIQGPMYRALLDRVNTAKNQPQMFASSQALYDELLNIYQAADPTLYSEALSDPLNVLADMSDGQLPRVNSLSKSQSQQANNAQDFGTGEQLIGNPSYGNWQTGSNGMSFWAWYGVYSMMGNMFGRPAYYSDWGRNRNYSYYNDYGRTRYSSPSQLNKQTQVEQRTKKSFASKGKTFNSPYSKNRTGSSSLSSKSKTAQSSANRFRSNTAKKSSYATKSKFGKSSSFRNSNTNTSRSFRRGK
ncbi:MAG: hypothetical protein QNK36_17500 [Colwellia sp.]|nr:hypothetical protein [Colwellia sp.]